MPEDALKLPEGHNAQAPADAPPQPLRNRPAVQNEAEQVEQTESPALPANEILGGVRPARSPDLPSSPGQGWPNMHSRTCTRLLNNHTITLDSKVRSI